MQVALLCTKPFVGLGTAQSKAFGVPDLPLVLIPHPLGGISVSDVEGRADHALPEIARLIKEAAQ